ncbi:uncharacterized protein LOC143636106 [Bidens hawaiensis]|uniref:uncharacterized protein LOC143636106 n=1 Tax=Bidens hawaiensis TaxID=980011 RepID=UPI00404A57D9
MADLDGDSDSGSVVSSKNEAYIVEEPATEVQVADAEAEVVVTEMKEDHENESNTPQTSQSSTIHKETAKDEEVKEAEIKVTSPSFLGRAGKLCSAFMADTSSNAKDFFQHNRPITRGGRAPTGRHNRRDGGSQQSGIHSGAYNASNYDVTRPSLTKQRQDIPHGGGSREFGPASNDDVTRPSFTKERHDIPRGGGSRESGLANNANNAYVTGPGLTKQRRNVPRGGGYRESSPPSSADVFGLPSGSSVAGQTLTSAKCDILSVGRSRESSPPSTASATRKRYFCGRHAIVRGGKSAGSTSRIGDGDALADMAGVFRHTRVFEDDDNELDDDDDEGSSDDFDKDDPSTSELVEPCDTSHWKWIARFW